MPVAVLGIWALALLQNIKGDYRQRVWGGSSQASSTSFLGSLQKGITSASFVDKEFYLPLLYRLNQGYIVSAVMEKVPAYEPYAGGSTLATAVRDAFVPRMLNENKEEAGGRQKIPRFTNLVLVGSTSMNIGILGETYANFGKNFGILFLLFYGLLIGLFEKSILSYSLKKPIILVLFPIFFEILVGSGSDFLMAFNSIVKSLMFIIPLLYFFERTTTRSAAPELVPDPQTGN